MPHTTTKNLRTKRPDTRPNEKLRRKLKGELEKGKTIQDLRVTRVQKSEKKERLAQPTELRTTMAMSAEEKRVRGLKKKIEAINILLEKRQKGKELDPQQLIKITTLDDILKEMEEILEGANNFNKTHYLAFVRATNRQKVERETGVSLKVSKKPSSREGDDGSSSSASKNEKYVKALRKKLQAIDKLVTMQDEGVKLDAQQLQKVAALDSVMEEMEKALAAEGGCENGEGKEKAEEEDDEEDDEDEMEEEEEDEEDEEEDA